MNKVLFLCIFGLVAIVCAEDEAVGKRVLAIIGSSDIKYTHSIFFKSLEERGYSLDYAVPTNTSVSLRKFGEWKYDNLILFAPSVEEFEGISESDVVEFIDDGKNVLIAADSSVSSFVSNIATECNVIFDEKGTSVIDHLNFDASNFDGNHDLIVTENVVDSPIVLGSKSIDAPILWRGVAQDIEEDSPLLFSILSGYPSSYSFTESGVIEKVPVSGKKTVLVSALQARNNARVVISGSLELFSDKFFNSPVQRYTPTGDAKRFEKSGNENFCKQLARWTFQERGILRIKSVSHHIVGEATPREMYTIKDEIEYIIEIEEYKGKKWAPFTASDVQLEFIRLDPHIRTTLKSDGNGKFSTIFTIPDVYGVFTFKVEYHRKGYGNLLSIERVSVRPFRHNQYERFIASAFPYYASAFSMMGGLFIFSWFFLYHREKQSTN